MASELRPAFCLEIVSDTICPWCYIAKKRLDAAIALLPGPLEPEIKWRPYELNPGMPREGVDRVTYRSAKFGSWGRSLELDAQVAEAGAADGLAFRHDLIKRTPNTLASHVMVHLAGQIGDQSAVAEALFQAYFADGRDVGDPDTLVAIGVEQGLDETFTRRALADENLRMKIAQEAEAYRRAGLNSVPTLTMNRFVLTAGAVQPARLAALLTAAMTDQRVIEAGRGAPMA